VIATLIDTKRPVPWSGAVGGGVISLVVHSTIIVAAVFATLQARRVETVRRPIVTVELPQENAPPPLPRVAPAAAPSIRFTTLAIPTDIPTAIPPPAQVAFDPSLFTGLGAGSASPWRRDTATARPVARPDAVYAADVLEQPPVWIGGPTPVYPDLLRRAGITGSVTVECIVDTAGRTEPGSVTIVRSTHSLFEQPARAAAAAWLFQPGRMDGRAVRVRVRIPLNFVVAS
jgi:protein TonB